MEWLIGKLFQKFGDRFSFLKPLSIVYKRGQKACFLTLLYPQDVSLSDQDKEEITNYLKEIFNLKAELNVKFKKSYLDDEFIFKALGNFFSSNYPIISGFLDKESFKTSRDFKEIVVSFKLDEEFLNYISEDKLKAAAREYLEKNFCSEFLIEIEKGRVAKEVDLEKKQEPPKPSTPRFDVEVLRPLFGGEIAPKPEFIKNVKTDKKSLILAGKVENLQKKAYEVKKGKAKGQTKFYYSFVLNDTTGRIEARHFAKSSTEAKMNLVKEGDSILILGDVETFAGRQTLYVHALSLCALPERVEFKQTVSKDYEAVSIEPYSILSQDNLFKVAATYPKEIEQKTFVVFDVETTGLNYEEDELLEIGAVKVENGKIVSRFASLIKPSRPIPPSATLINNITDEMVASCPSVEPVLRDFYRYTRGAALVGYNVSFDQKFILQAARKQGLLFDNEFIDLMPLAKSKLRLSRYKLTDVVKRLEITLDGAHRAYADALATAEAFLKLNSKEFA